MRLVTGFNVVLILFLSVKNILNMSVNMLIDSFELTWCEINILNIVVQPFKNWW